MFYILIKFTENHWPYHTTEISSSEAKHVFHLFDVFSLNLKSRFSILYLFELEFWGISLWESYCCLIVIFNWSIYLKITFIRFLGFSEYFQIIMSCKNNNFINRFIFLFLLKSYNFSRNWKKLYTNYDKLSFLRMSLLWDIN